MAVSEQILPAQQHLQLGFRQELAEGPQALPGIFVQESNAGIEGGPAPAFQRPVAGIIQVLASWDHIFHGHAGGQETLMGISEN
jgi:hypothetical protein